ncbi:40S ribosomal protein S5-1 [Hordeum vulgare]|nr:40S ribosomal protein S5-1 [Hordeum vulgare]
MDKIFEKVINPYLSGVLQHPQSIKMREGMLHIRDVEGPNKTGSMETRLEAMEQQVFKCQGMVERGLNANYMMITEFNNKHMINVNDIGKHLSGHYDRIDQLQDQIYDLQNQNYEYEYRFKSIRLDADLRIPVTRSYFHDGTSCVQEGEHPRSLEESYAMAVMGKMTEERLEEIEVVEALKKEIEELRTQQSIKN